MSPGYGQHTHIVLLRAVCECLLELGTQWQVIRILKKQAFCGALQAANTTCTCRMQSACELFYDMSLMA